MNKREMSVYIKQQAAALLRAMDLDQLLGTKVLEEICDDEEMMEWCEQVRDRIADRVHP